ncbi:MAG: hypothetical protein ACI9G1_001430 [Pirellulaceae bacterium]|jgi:hypothetical protein
MKHVDANGQPEEVKQFLLSLDLGDDGSIVECNGKRIHVSQPQDTDAIADIQRGYEELMEGKGRPFEEADASIRSELRFTPRQS